MDLLNIKNTVGEDLDGKIFGLHFSQQKCACQKKALLSTQMQI